jgi:type II secretory pathway pseudopilin PulG
MILAILFAVAVGAWWGIRDMQRIRRETGEAIEQADQDIAEYRKWLAQMPAEKESEEKRKRTREATP